MSHQQLFNIELPIIQAPMAGVQGSAMAIAVANAGGLGSLPAAMLSPEVLQRELSALQAGTAQPYNLNFFCHSTPSPDAAREQAWRTALALYYTECGIDPNSMSAGAGRVPFDQTALDIVKQFRPPVVSFHFGLPNLELLEQVRATGAKILSTATTLAEARWLAAQGIDGIIAQGLEAGGHRGMFLTEDLTTQIGTLALVRQLVKTVDIPVIAAGGIADAKGVKAALELGAVAAQVGTAYLLCSEASTSQLHRAALQSAAAEHTALTNLFTGRPARGILNRLMRDLGPISPLAPSFPLATAAIAPLRAHAEAQGNSDFSPLWAGQNAQGCKAISAAELTRELAAFN
jgi:nitronate monooxygenase